jgi:hypothetical protein
LQGEKRLLSRDSDLHPPADQPTVGEIFQVGKLSCVLPLSGTGGPIRLETDGATIVDETVFLSGSLSLDWPREHRRTTKSKLRGFQTR